MAEITAAAKAPGNLVEFVRQAQEGSNDAAQALYDQCREPLLTVIRIFIFPPLRRLYDSDDFLLMTLEAVFTRHFSDEVLQSRETLWPYLKRIAENKVRDANRKFLSPREDILRDVSLDTLTPEEQDKLISKDLSPEEIYLLKELVEERLEDFIGQLPDMLQTIVRLSLKGATGDEIAHGLGVDAKRVYRAIEWLRKKIMVS
jgi:RNA polymerase sigma factor (sigma-70 family)